MFATFLGLSGSEWFWYSIFALVICGYGAWKTANGPLGKGAWWLLTNKK
jgi:hypothetical protein